MGSDYAREHLRLSPPYFNPRSRVGSDHNSLSIRRNWKHFNPRSRVGSDRLILRFHGKSVISIHAPAWGATKSVCPVLYRQEISIHAPAWGATSTSDASQRLSAYFNPRSRVGSDLAVPCQACSVESDFNPRSRVGSDLYRLVAAHNAIEFQSTLPRGERP